jgi:hypothetical protein
MYVMWTWYDIIGGYAEQSTVSFNPRVARSGWAFTLVARNKDAAVFQKLTIMENICTEKGK